MLVLTRKRNQSIMVNDNIELTIIDIQGDQVRVGINAPKDVKVFRKEVYVEMTEENKKASNVQLDALSMLKNAILKQKKYPHGYFFCFNLTKKNRHCWSNNGYQ